MPAVTYPVDETGLAPSNFVQNEIHPLTEVNAAPYRIIVPKFAPFYVDNFALRHIDSVGVSHPLQLDVDYYHTLLWMGGSNSIGKVLYGGVAIRTDLIEGNLSMDYQTIGGDWTADPSVVYETMAEIIYNDRIISWDQVSNRPVVYPPTVHAQHMDTVFGHEQLIEAIREVATTIGSMPSQSLPLVQHLLNMENPHATTKDQVGLDQVQNLPIASNDDIVNNVPANKYVTLAQLIQWKNLHG